VTARANSSSRSRRNSFAQLVFVRNNNGAKLMKIVSAFAVAAFAVGAVGVLSALAQQIRLPNAKS